MIRRKFVRLTGVGTAGTLLYTSGLSSCQRNDNMTAEDLNTYLRSIIEVDEPSVDRIVIGDPNTEITKIGTAWMPYWKTLKKAVEAGVNTLVVHEPAFYTHWDLDAKIPAKDNYSHVIEDKKKWIEDNGLVIIRCHDVLDKVPEWGIPYAFGKGLGLTNESIVRSKKFYNVYKIDPTPASEVAKNIASHLKTINQPGVAFYGDENYTVETIGLGTGCICDPLDYAELKPDLFIGIDDTIRTWIQTTYAEDTGQPLIVINHGTSEEFGMQSLNEHLKTRFKNFDVIHFNQGCGYKWIS
ncbi:Nif3-like dinuclear metal center hexameric protein [Bacteroidota bacterium]